MPIVLAFVGLFICLHCKDSYIRDNGEIAEATVYAQSYVNGIRRGLTFVSWSYFKVNDSTMQIFNIIGKDVPINTKFNVIYLPEDPRKALVLNPKEFDKYPRR
jgi:hypothetical protein